MFGDPAIRAVQQATRRIPIVGMADDIHCHCHGRVMGDSVAHSSHSRQLRFAGRH
jgi:hypothetical protein